MNTHHLPLIVALIASVLPVITFSQASAPATTASVPTPAGPRLLSPAEKRANADVAAAPDLRPDRPVVPQISIPFGRKPAPEPNRPVVTRRTAPPTTGRIGDSAARCESVVDEADRAACLKRAATQTKPPG